MNEYGKKPFFSLMNVPKEAFPVSNSRQINTFLHQAQE